MIYSNMIDFKSTDSPNKQVYISQTLIYTE